MRGVLFLAPAIAMLGAVADAEIPPGYEVVEISSGMVYHDRPRMNNCGEIVFCTGFAWTETAQILLYDNGALIPIIQDDGRDMYPDINDHGTIVWTREFDGGAVCGTIAMLRDGEVSLLGQGLSPSINNLGHVAWKLIDHGPCDSPSVILFYDGSTVETIIDDGLSNQSVRLNDNDEMVWTRYDFSSCGGPGDDWSSEIMLHSDGVTSVLPSTLTYPQLPDINNLGEAAWGDFDALEFWDGSETILLADGHIPALNNVGGLAFGHKPEGGMWELWLYRDEEFTKISDDPGFHNGRPDINDAGEIAWWWTADWAALPSGIRFMRRIRDGDVDFNGDVNLDDFADLPGCLTGPVDTDHLCECRFYDIDHDRDVDLADFASFQNRFGMQPSRDCCTPHDSPGCSDPDIEACVCDVCYLCCQPPWEWDEYCVSLVEILDCGTCP